MTRSAAKFWWKVDLPKDVIYMYHNGGYCMLGGKPDWKAYTRKELIEKKVAAQNSNLWRKRRCPKIVYGFVHVFYVDWFLFGGWWLYITTHKKDYGISFHRDGEYNAALILKSMQMFPCGIRPVMENFDTWAEKFASRFPHAKVKRPRPEGLRMVRCSIDEYGKLLDILPIR